MPEQIYYEDVNIGDQMPSLVKDPVQRVQMVKYAGASGDFHPAHTDDLVGKQLGMGGRFAHGMLVMGFIGEAITNWISKKYLKKLGVKFVGVTKPEDIITVTANIVGKDDKTSMITCDIFAKDQKDEIKIKGTFSAQLPVRG